MKPGKEATAEVKKTNNGKLSKEQAQEVMKKRGYEFVAGSGNGKAFFFRKMLEGKEWSGTGIHAKVNLDREQVELTFSDLQYAYTLNSYGFAIDHENFNKFEKILIEYARALISIDPLSKIEKKKIIPSSIGERKINFWAKITPLAKKKEMSKEDTLEFFKHWTQMNEGGKKMWFEMQKMFDINRRLDTWRGNEKKWNKSFISEKVEKQNEDMKIKKVVKKKDIF